MTRRVALVIGNATYSTATPLANPNNDARLVSEVLADLKFEFITVGQERYNCDADRQSMSRLCADLAEAAESAEIAVVYYAGHGIQLDGKNYIIPVDADLKHVKRLYHEALLLENFTTAIAGVATLGLILLDACRDSPFPEPMRGAHGSAVGSVGSFTHTDVSGNQSVLYAAQAGATAFDSLNGSSNSPFALALAECLGQPLALASALSNVIKLVRKQTGEKQKPALYGDIPDTLFLSAPPSKPPISVDEHQSGDGKIIVKARRFKDNCGPRLTPGQGNYEWFRDHDRAPEMVVIPRGSFERAFIDEYGATHIRTVTIPAEFAISRYPITVGLWRDAQEDAHWFARSGMPPHLSASVGQNPKVPATFVSWRHAKAYVRWLSKLTDMDYSLPTEAEWEYACRSGARTKFWWGDAVNRKKALYAQEEGTDPAPVEKFEPNPWGLYQVHGNVWEWVEDTWHKSLVYSPTNGSAWTSPDTQRRVVRGGSRFSAEHEMAADFRRSIDEELFLPDVGFRVVRHRLS